MILLARHGETKENRERRFQGQNDVPLSDKGIEQAHALAELAANEHPPIVALYTSPQRRAKQTAEVVAGRLGLAPREDPRLKEVDVGDWEGRLKDDVEREDPQLWAAFRRAGDGFRFPGGESLAEQQERVIEALVDVTQRGELPALLVCHRGVVRCALAHTHRRGLETYHEWKVPNAELVRL
ncbi:MAG: histidine phosphatase family protein [Actinomycetota bacterium]|nr:histidine phosphatase family protein [Actinomycetota bacterium]MDQ5808631.1 histidine phosphatase family protein [Actinomycetota bacterium]